MGKNRNRKEARPEARIGSKETSQVSRWICLTGRNYHGSITLVVHWRT